MELASCHPSGVCNLRADARFSENLWTPVVRYTRRQKGSELNC